MRTTDAASGSWRSCGAPELDGIGERAGLLANRLHLRGVLGVLEADVGDVDAVQRALEHGPVEERGVAEARRGEDDALGAVALHRVDEELALQLAIRLVLRRGLHRPVEERVRELV